jgi:hypothetical protein
VTESYSTTVDGGELVAEQIEDGWRVRFGSKVVEAEFIDHALAQAIWLQARTGYESCSVSYCLKRRELIAGSDAWEIDASVSPMLESADRHRR